MTVCIVPLALLVIVTVTPGQQRACIVRDDSPTDAPTCACAHAGGAEQDGEQRQDHERDTRTSRGTAPGLTEDREPRTREPPRAAQIEAER